VVKANRKGKRSASGIVDYAPAGAQSHMQKPPRGVITASRSASSRSSGTERQRDARARLGDWARLISSGMVFSFPSRARAFLARRC
jgi:hypothetical protein